VNGGNGPTNGNIVWSIVAIVGLVLICSTLVLLLAPEADVAPILGTLAPTVAALGALAQVSRMQGKVDRVDQHVEDLSNGLMDSKIRAGIADVIPDELLDDTYARHQLADDRIRRQREGHPPDLV
jgi:hypothetical protein